MYMLKFANKNTCLIVIFKENVQNVICITLILNFTCYF